MQTATAERRETEYLNYRESVLIDEMTWVAENLEAKLEKPLRYQYRDNELWSEQNQPLGEIFEKSVKHYKRLADARPELAFQYRRSLAERREYWHMLDMARGKAPNTATYISTYPDELKDATEDVLGYKANRKLGFIRAIRYEGDGQIEMWTRSFDRNDREGIEAMYGEFGESVDWSRDVLEQPVFRDIADADEREQLGLRVLRAYDASLSRRQGGTWVAGRNDDERREAIAFVMSQQDLLHAHTDALIYVGPKSSLANDLRYDFAAAMRRRFEGDFRFAKSGSIAAEMGGAGGDARDRGETASGCGLTLGPTVEEGLAAAGYSVKEKKFEAKGFGECRVCLRTRTIGSCAVCSNCEEADDSGFDLETIHKEALKRRKREAQAERYQSHPTLSQNTTPSVRSKDAHIQSKYGAHARIKVVKVIGGADRFVYDDKTGETIDKL